MKPARLLTCKTLSDKSYDLYDQAVQYGQFTAKIRFNGFGFFIAFGQVIGGSLPISDEIFTSLKIATSTSPIDHQQHGS